MLQWLLVQLGAAADSASVAALEAYGAAYEVLSDQKQRDEYDGTLKNKVQLNKISSSFCTCYTGKCIIYICVVHHKRVQAKDTSANGQAKAAKAKDTAADKASSAKDTAAKTASNAKSTAQEKADDLKQQASTLPMHVLPC